MLIAGEALLFDGRVLTVNARDIVHVDAMRAYLIDVARARNKATYSELVDGAELPYPARGLGRLLELLSEDCERRGEPGLAALVVAKSTGEVGAGYGGDAQRERDRVYAFWADTVANP
jgi:hypothetical protein